MDLLPIANTRCYELNSEFESDHKLFYYQNNFIEYVCNHHTDKRKYMLMFEAGTGKTYAYIKTIERLIKRGVYEKAEIITRAVLHTSIRNHIPSDLMDVIHISSFKTFCDRYVKERMIMSEVLDRYKKEISNCCHKEQLFKNFCKEYIFKYGENNIIYIFDEIQVVLGEGAYINDTRTLDGKTFENVIRDLYRNFIDKPTSNILTIFSTATLMVNTAAPACKFASTFNLFKPEDDQTDPMVAAKRIVETCEIFIYENEKRAIKDHFITHPFLKSTRFPNVYILPVSTYRASNLSVENASTFHRKSFERGIPLYAYEPMKAEYEKHRLHQLLESKLSSRFHLNNMEQLRMFCNIIANFSTSIAFIIYNEIKAFINKEPGYAIAYYENHIANGAHHLIDALQLLGKYTNIATRPIHMKKESHEEREETDPGPMNVAMDDSEQIEMLELTTEVYKYCLVESGNAGYFSNKILPRANSKENVGGKICNLVMFSAVFREGVSFSNVLRKYYPVSSWNLTSKYQVEYRTLRSNSFDHFDVASLPDKYKTEDGRVYPHNFTFCYTLRAWDFTTLSYIDMIEGTCEKGLYEQVSLDDTILEKAYQKQVQIHEVEHYLKLHNNKNFLGLEKSRPDEFLSYNMFDIVRSAIQSDFNMCLLSEKMTKGIVNFDIPLVTAVMNKEFVVMPMTKLDDNYASTTAPVTISKGNIVMYRSITQS